MTLRSLPPYSMPLVLAQPTKDKPHLYADKGYDEQPAQDEIIAHGYAPRVSRKKRRWVVEVSHSWLNRFRKLLFRYQKCAEAMRHYCT